VTQDEINEWLANHPNFQYIESSATTFEDTFKAIEEIITVCLPKDEKEGEQPQESSAEQSEGSSADPGSAE